LERLDFLLLGIVLLAAIPRLYLGATQFVEYDGYWHVFTAQQDRWRNFVWDCRYDAHPPLYYFLLRLTLWLGHSHLAYRAISLLTGLGSIVVLGRIAAKMTRSALTPPLVALAYGLALPAIIISCEVRSYMLCGLLMLVAYSYFLDQIDSAEPAGSLRPRIVFAVSASLACVADYYAVFFVCALFGISMVLPVLRRREPLWRAWAREGITFSPILGTLVWLYLVHLSRHPVIQEHLLEYYYDPHGGTSLGEFLLRNLQSTFDLFSPWPAPDRDAFLAIAGGLLLAGCATVWLLRRLWAPKNLAAATTVVATVLILAQVIVASLVRLHPFGGLMRQQFLLFPFLVLGAFFLPDRLAAAIPRRAAYALAASLALAIGAVSYSKFASYPKFTGTLMTEQMQRFNLLFPSPAAVYVDQYNVIAFFLHHHDWKWKFVGRVVSVPNVDTYRVSRGNQQMFVFREKGGWLLDGRDRTLYANLAACLRSRGLPDIVVFRLGQDDPSPWDARELRAYRKTVGELSSANGLCVQNLVLHSPDVFLDVRAGGCTGEPPR
jgi:hypothetical protein